MNSSEKHTSRAQNQTSISSQNGSPLSSQDEFFIPDLCNARSVFILVIASELFALIVSVVSHPLPDFHWVSFALVSLLTQWITLSSAAVICGLRPWFQKLNPRLALLLCLFIVLLDTALFSVVGEWALAPSLISLSFWETLNYWSVAQNMLIGIIISGMVFRYFLVQHQLRLKEKAELTARLQSLQSRIRPHFLFNSMNIIASLIASDPDTAETVVEDLSELFRASLQETANVVPLATEIELCKKYCRIEQLRLGKRLRVNWQERDFSEDLYQTIEIPMLLLQPLLENAIYHGIQPRAEGGEVTITLAQVGERIELTVVNPLPEASYYTSAAKQSKGNQMALDNIRHRLSAIYGEQGKLEQTQVNNEFVTVLSFPASTLGYDQKQNSHL